MTTHNSFSLTPAQQAKVVKLYQDFRQTRGIRSAAEATAQVAAKDYRIALDTNDVLLVLGFSDPTAVATGRK